MTNWEIINKDEEMVIEWDRIEYVFFSLDLFIFYTGFKQVKQTKKIQNYKDSDLMEVRKKQNKQNKHQKLSEG